MSFQDGADRDGRQPFVVVDLELDSCSRSYGVAPCTAAVGTTGDEECYNTRATCQDTANYNGTTLTHRLCSRGQSLPGSLDAIPCVESVKFTSGRFVPGGLGIRSGVTIVCQDFVHNDRGVDPYIDNGNRSQSDPAASGTYFGKLRARNQYYAGRQISVWEGYLPASGAFSFSDMRERVYFIESVEGPDAAGRVRIKASDVLKLADGLRSQIPAVSTGNLTAALSDSGTTLTFTNNTVAQGYKDTDDYVRIGDEVILLGTVSSNTITGCTRGQFGTTAEAHDNGDHVQSCYSFSSEPVRDLLEDALTSYAPIASSYIDTAQWDEEETESLSGYDLTGIVTEPQPVEDFVNDVLRQCLLSIYWDEIDQKLKLFLNTPWVDVDTAITDEAIVAGSMKVKDRHDLRVTQAWVFYDERNATEDPDPGNFRALHVEADTDGESADTYGQAAITKVAARYMDSANSTQAELTAQRLVERFVGTPRSFTWRMDAQDVAGLRLGKVLDVTSRVIQDQHGQADQVRVQVLELRTIVPGHLYEVEALVYQWSPGSGGTVSVTISADQTDYDLHVDISGPSGPVTVDVTINASVWVYATSTGTPAFTTGALHPDSSVDITNNGYIAGKGGAGGGGGRARAFYSAEPPGFYTYTGFDGSAGNNGGTGLEINVNAITIDNTSGYIYGGGGGGGGGGGLAGGGEANGGGGGGGGQSKDASSGGAGGLALGNLVLNNGTAGSSGTDSGAGAGGAGAGNAGDGGAGGAWGDDGTDGDDAGVGSSSGSGASAGTAGAAIESNGATITWEGGSTSPNVEGAIT